MDMDHTIDERAGERSNNGGVLRSVSGADHNRSFGQVVFADASLVNQAVEGLLDLMRAGVELIQKQTVGLVSSNDPRGTKPARIANDLGYTDEIFGSELATQK